MDGEIKFSIVMPTFNAEKYVAKMIESVIGQTYKNWELIIIDDGSTDNSGNICDRFVDERINVFHIENQGQIGARMEGISKCRGEYTLVVDADDYLHQSCLEVAYGILVEHDYDCIAFPYSICDEQLNFISNTIGFSQSGVISQKDFLMWIIETLNHPLYNKVIKTEIIRTGCKEAIRKKVSINGDYALIIPIICVAKDIYYYAGPLYYYRVLDNSISHNRKYQQILDTDLVTSSIVEIMKKYKVCEPFLEKMIYRQYFNMLIWLFSEVCKKQFITRNEISFLRESAFFQQSKKLEDKMDFNIVKRVLIRTIRKYGVLGINTIFGVFNILTWLKSIINKRVSCKLKKYDRQ